MKPFSDAMIASEIAMGDSYQAIKMRAFALVLEHLESKNLTADRVSRTLLQDEIAQAIPLALSGEGTALNSLERSRLIQDVLSEIVGLGPLEPLLADPTIEDIVVNGPLAVYIERAGRMSRAPVRFHDSAHVMNIIQRIVGPIGRRVDESTPFVDARLPDGSRVNIVIPPVALDGPTISIRKFRKQVMDAQQLVAGGAMSREMADYLSKAVKSRLNMLVVGGTGSGKTTLLNSLSRFIDVRERLVTIEDAAELQLDQEHVVRLETRGASADGTREVSARDLMKNALRMRPDRVVLGEVRGAEAIDMLQAMSTGHDGSMSTLHANSPRDALSRLEMLIGFGGMNAESGVLRRFIASSINLIVHIQRGRGGARRIRSIAEVTGVEGEAYRINEMFILDESAGEPRFTTVSSRSHYERRLTHGWMA